MRIFSPWSDACNRSAADQLSCGHRYRCYRCFILCLLLVESNCSDTWKPNKKEKKCDCANSAENRKHFLRPGVDRFDVCSLSPSVWIKAFNAALLHFAHHLYGLADWFLCGAELGSCVEMNVIVSYRKCFIHRGNKGEEERKHNDLFLYICCNIKGLICTRISRDLKPESWNTSLWLHEDEN